MRHLCLAAAVLLIPVLPVWPLRAGLHYSGEAFAELPSQWRGFLLEQRSLRNLAVKPLKGQAQSPGRARYEAEAARLAGLSKERALTADEAADLGALYVRLGDVSRALEVLRPAQRAHPVHFRLFANLGTAWQLHGDLEQAAAALEQAVRLAPGKYQKAEELHLKLVRLRARRPGDTQDLDDLFGVRFVGPHGKYEPGKLDPAQRKLLPADAVPLVQQLALWLPADPLLLWQLAELAGAHGDVATSAAILDGCVTEFGLRSSELRAHRQAARTAADEQARGGAGPGKAAHEGHAGLVKFRSSRPLLHKIDQAPLAPIDPKGVNALPWTVVGETSLNQKFQPTFPRYLKELDGCQVSLSGFMQPVTDELECSSFLLIEFPVGCWYCEMPEMTGIILVEMPAGKTRTYTRAKLQITGKITLNDSDPENFLYIIREAKVVEEE